MVSLPSKREPQWLSPDSIIFAARGSRNFAYTLDGVPQQAVCAPQFFVISPHIPDAVDPAFLAWQINQRPAQEYIAQTATGAAMPNVRRKALEALPIVLPPIEQQRQIAELYRASREERAILARLMANRDKQMEALAWDLLETAKGARA
jgi:restriction endonuclease S subunit